MIDFMTNFLASNIRLAMPVLLAALGLVFSARSGVIIIGAEGGMLIGALIGYAGSFWTGSAWLGLLIAIGTGFLVGLLFAFMVVTLRADQTITGIAFNLLGIGISVTLNRVIFGIGEVQQKVDFFKSFKIPFLGDIPIIGPSLFDNNILVFVTILILILSHYVMFKTELGLKIRSVGENPKACDTLGINVYRLRYSTIIYAFMLCGLGGAYMSLAQVTYFIEGMVAGRGYMALAAVTFGKFKPMGVLYSALLFGAGIALQFRLQAMGTGIPFQLLSTIPYVLTIIALAGLVGKVYRPAATGQPYTKE